MAIQYNKIQLILSVVYQITLLRVRFVFSGRISFHIKQCSLLTI